MGTTAGATVLRAIPGDTPRAQLASLLRRNLDPDLPVPPSYRAAMIARLRALLVTDDRARDETQDDKAA